MGSPTVIEAGELTPREVVERLKMGDRVIVRTEFLGSIQEITLRWDGETFYCDTPTRLHKHDSESEMLDCLKKQGYAEPQVD